MGLGWVGLGWLRPYVMLVRLNVTIELSNVSKKKKPLNVTEIRSYVMMEQSKMRKTIRVPPNVTKVRSEVMLILHNKIIELSNVRKIKNKKTTENDKRIVTCDVRTAQYKDETVKCEKKK